MSKLSNMRLIEIAPFAAAASAPGPLDEIFGEGGFDEWVQAHPQFIHKPIAEPGNFLWHEDSDIDRSVLIYPVKDGVLPADVAPHRLITFPGGMYLVATADENDPDDLEETVSGMIQWIERSDVFCRGGFPESGMCNMPNGGGRIDRALGIAQQQIFLPLEFTGLQAQTGFSKESRD